MKCMGKKYDKFDCDHRDGTILHHPCIQPLDAQICDYLCLTQFFLGMKVMKSNFINLHIQKTIETLLLHSHTFWTLNVRCLKKQTWTFMVICEWFTWQTIGDGTIMQNKPTNLKTTFKCVRYDEKKGLDRRTINYRQPWLGRSKL
jgi:hypothetical protein